MSRGFDIIALNSNYEIISILNYTLLQWTRKYYESGYFSIEIPIELYSKDYKYIYTAERPELGKIEQVNYYIKNNYKSITISGHFLENELNRRIVYQKAATTNITNAPTWTVQKDKAEVVAFAFFDAFKDLTFDNNGTTYTTDLKIEAGTNQGRGQTSEHTRGDEKLGAKIYRILRYSKMSYRVAYDFDTSKRVFSCWTGLDRTSGNTAGNNPIVFSTTYGNITNADLLISTQEYMNSYIVGRGEDSEKKAYVIAGNERASDDEDDTFIYRESAELESDYATQADFLAALRADGHERMLLYPKTISLDFDVIESSYIYRTDFDLGDQVSIELPELGISTDAVLSGIYEVVKNGVWSMTLEFTLDD